MKPKVSIIIPVKNEESFIGACIESIERQSYPQDLIEILVIDGMSSDNTLDKIRKYQQNNNNLKVLFNEKFITPISMNIGIKNSTGEIIIIVGGHSTLHEDFVKNNVRNLMEKKADCSGGVIETINDGIVGEAIAEAMSCPFGVGNALFRYTEKEQYVDTVPFGAYKKEILNKIGYFDEELVRNQDDELNLRLTKSGGKVLLSPDIKAKYYSRSSLKKLWNQYKQYGFWKVRVIQKHKKPAALRHLIPITFVLALLSGIIGSLFSPIFTYGLLLVIIPYLIIDLYFSLKISSKKQKGYLKYLLVIFPILHVSYGWGFLLGIINFYILKSKRMSKKNTSISR